MKTNKFFLPLLLLIAIVGISSCKRNNQDDPKASVDAKEIQHSEDADRVSAESDQITSDADNALSATSVGRVEGTTSIPICGGTIDSSLLAQKTIKVTYDGVTVCNGYIRTGSITLKLIAGTHWRDAGSVVEITHTAYKVTRTSDNKNLQFDGVKWVTNVNGNQTLSRQYKERGTNLSLTFDDGTQRTWSLARNWGATITNISPLSITYYISGDSTVNGTQKAMAWGTNRYGTAFTNSTPVTIVTSVGQNGCGFSRPTAGKHVHALTGKGTLTTTLGVDASGNAVSSGCAYGFKLNWVGSNGQTAEVIKAYK